VVDLAKREGLEAELTLTSVSGPLTLALKVSLVTGIVLSCPIWLYQLWAFILPGLHAKERRLTLLFVGVAGPLFMGGVAVGYYVLPKGLSILLDFTPADVSNLVELGGYLNFILRMLLVFGVAFEIPVFVLLLNLAGVLSGRQLGEHRPWIIIGTFIFAAVATPSTDPVSMLFLALPMTVLWTGAGAPPTPTTTPSTTTRPRTWTSSTTRTTGGAAALRRTTTDGSGAGVARGRRVRAAGLAGRDVRLAGRRDAHRRLRPRPGDGHSRAGAAAGPAVRRCRVPCAGDG
jgi:Tat protein translocase TatC